MCGDGVRQVTENGELGSKLYEGLSCNTNWAADGATKVDFRV